MAPKLKKKHSASTESFEHVALDDAASPAVSSEASASSASEPPPAAVAAPAAATAPAEAPAEAAAAGGEAEASGDGDDSSLLPPATQALTSVLNFFGASTVAASAVAAVTGQHQQPAAAAEAGAAAAAADKARAAAAEEEEGDAVEQLEREVAEMAEEVSQKLRHGAAEAKEALGSLATGLTSWWAAAAAPALGQAGGADAGTTRTGSTAQELSEAVASLGLEGGESVLESFACSLLQTYTATSNFFTPPRQIAFRGGLHVTSRRLCFAFSEPGLAPIKLAAKQVTAAAKLPADAAKGLPERLEVRLAAKGQALVLANFSVAAELELDSALALVEHLAAEGGAQ